MAWQIRLGPEAERWYRGLSEADARRATTALDELWTSGPTLPATRSKRIVSSRHREMRELRVPGSNMRALYAFDQRRIGTVLLGGDKTDQWRSWYARNVKRADRLYDLHLDGQIGGRSWHEIRAGRKSAQADR